MEQCIRVCSFTVFPMVHYKTHQFMCWPQPCKYTTYTAFSNETYLNIQMKNLNTTCLYLKRELSKEIFVKGKQKEQTF